MSPRARALLAREVPSRRGAAVIGLLFLAGAVIAVAVGNILPAAFLAAGVALILIAYLATYGATWRPREDEERPG